MGVEKSCQSLKCRYPARPYGFTCVEQESCPVKGAIRIPLAKTRRIFPPLARSSYPSAVAYRKRTAVERAKSRLDTSFGFENHTIRGSVKVKVRCGLALCVMLATGAHPGEETGMHAQYRRLNSKKEATAGGEASLACDCSVL